MSVTVPPPPAWQAHWARWRHWVGVVSFAAGIASFFLFERQEKAAQALVILLPLSWLAIGLEPWLMKLAQRGRLGAMSPLLLAWLTQGLHQESFFFTLPFFIASTSWLSPQLFFMLLLGAVALATLVDPFYFGQVVRRRWLFWSFHAAAGFITVLAAAPLLWHLTTRQSLMLAAACLALLSVPAWSAALQRLGAIRWPLAMGLGLLLGVTVLQLRSAIPPATLRVTQSQMSGSLDVSTRTPGPALTEIGDAQLRHEGLYAWTAIRAPRGLHERVEHHWLHEGRVIDRIPIAIAGGRAQGYRAWTHKRVFPQDARGAWEVRVVTEGGQRIGATRFTVR